VKNLIKDEEFKKMLNEKHKYEMFSWLIPVISIISLLLILYLTSESYHASTVVVLVIIILLIIFGYIFDDRLSNQTQTVYDNLNNYFQNKIVPELLTENNPTIVFDSSKKISIEQIDKLELFDNYLQYKSRFHYKGIMEGCHYTFDELLFDQLVGYDTKEIKEENDGIKSSIHYHVYTINLDKDYSIEALFKAYDFENYEKRLLKTYKSYDISNNPFMSVEEDFVKLYFKDNQFHRALVGGKILSIFTNSYLKSSDLFIGYSIISMSCFIIAVILLTCAINIHLKLQE